MRKTIIWSTTMAILFLGVAPARATTLLSSGFDISQSQGWPDTDQNQEWECGASSSYSSSGHGYVITDDAHSPRNCVAWVDLADYEIFGELTAEPDQSDCDDPVPPDTETCEVTQGFILRVQDADFDTRLYWFLELVCRITDGAPRDARLQDQLLIGAYKEKQGDVKVGVAGEHAPCSEEDVYNVRVRIKEATGMTQVRGKAWVDGMAEPTGWQFEDEFTQSGRPLSGGIGYQGASPATNIPNVTFIHGLDCVIAVSLPVGDPTSCT